MNIDNKFYQKFTLDMAMMGLNYDDRLLEAVIKHLGPSIQNADSYLVACSDKKETDYIKSAFLVGKLGLDENDPNLEAAIEKACELMGSENRHKSRITFYYLLMIILNVPYAKLD